MIGKDDIIGMTLSEITITLLLLVITFSTISSRKPPEPVGPISAGKPMAPSDVVTTILNPLAIKELKNIYDMINGKITECEFTGEFDDKAIEIIIQGRQKSISFDTAKFDLNTEDKERLSKLSLVLFENIKDKHCFIIINGQADPRDFKRTKPPRDNAELSALRAGTVAALLENAAPGIGEKVHVVGLGVKGKLITEPTMLKYAEEIYRKYRSVVLVVKIDKEMLFLRK